MGRLRDIFLYFWNFRYLSIKYRWPLIKLRRRLLPTETGLCLRYSLGAARDLRHPPRPNPYLFVLRLLWPFPSWHFPAVLPPPPRAIIATPDTVCCQIRDLMLLRMMPLWRVRDTPQRSFYRLYEAVCASDGHMITYETEYFWGHSSPQWATVHIPDPECNDPEQYAVMASVAEVLALSCTWRLEIGLRRNGDMEDPDGGTLAVLEYPPPWTAKVPRLEDELILDSDNVLYFDSPFHSRNITTSTGNFYTV